MHIVLVAPPKENIVSTTIPEDINKERGFSPPLGLLYIASYLKANSAHTVTVIDSEIERLDYHALKLRLEGLKPDLVGIQVLTFTLIDALKTAAIVKELSKDIPVVFGGPHVTIFPAESLAHKDVDYIVRSEGEISFKELLDNMKDSSRLSSVRGIGFKRGSAMTVTEEPSFIRDLDSLPMPDRRLTPYQKYYSLLSKNFPITTMMTSRGCPYNCIFCERMGKTFRAKSPEKIIAEIEDCLSLGIKEIFFHDDTFTVDKKRVFRICEMISERGLKFDWDARVRVDTVNAELLKAMKKAGCRRISFGVESGSSKVLKKLRKGITLGQVTAAFEYAQKSRIQTLADFMIGSPGETEDDVSKTMDLAKKLHPDYVQFSITTPYPGTDLYRDAISSGMVKSDVWKEFAVDPKSDFKPPLWTEYFSREELLKMSDKAYKSFYLSPGFMIREALGMRSLGEVAAKFKAGLKLLKK